MKSEVKTARITLPESIYMQLKQAAKSDKNYKSVGDYIVHQLDSLKILTCENDRLSRQLQAERVKAAGNIAASEQRVAVLEEKQQELCLLNADLTNQLGEQRKQNGELSERNGELSSQNAELREEKEQLKEINQSELSIRLKAESDLQAIGIELRKKEQEKSELENKIASRNAIIEGLHQELREKRTFLGKIKNLFS